MAEFDSVQEDWTEKLIVKYIGQKISKVKWKPSRYGQFNGSSRFVSGAWDDQENLLCLWNACCTDQISGTNQSSLGEPELLCSMLHQGSVTDINFTDKGQLVTSSSCGDITVYEINQDETGFIVQQQWKGLHHSDGFSTCSCTSISINQDHIVSVGEDGRVTMLQVGNNTPLRVIDSADCVTINAVTHINSSEIATIGSTGQLKLWDLRDHKTKSSKTMFLSGDKISLESLDRHPYQPHLLVTGAADGIVGIWDTRHERFPVTLIEAHQSEVWEVKFHPKNPDNLFTCSEDGSAWYWDGTSITSSQDGTHKPPVPRLNTPSLTTNQQLSSPWLYLDTNKHKMETYSLLPFNRLSVNSIDIDCNALLCGTDGEAIIVVQDLPIK